MMQQEYRFIFGTPVARRRSAFLMLRVGHEDMGARSDTESITLRVSLSYGDQNIPDAATRTARQNKNQLDG